MRIAISGLSGCGNTTATTNVGSRLGIKTFNFTFRDLAKELGISFEQLHQEAPHNRVFDLLTDLHLMRASLSPDVVVGTRLAAWLMNADLRIWLHASLEVRASRINRRESEKNTSYEAVLYKTLKRDEQNRKRYLELYGLDINDHNDFDITINTQLLTAEQVSGLIVEAANWAKTNLLERKNLHLHRVREIIQKDLGLDPKVFVDPKIPVNYSEIYLRTKSISA
jgi:cytidylate kinase